MNPRYLLILVVLLVSLPVFAVLGLFNLYLLGGIAFPSDGFATAYALFWLVLIYGGMFAMPVVAALLVRLRDLPVPGVVGLLSLPFVAQGLAFVAYIVLGERYGYVCC